MDFSYNIIMKVMTISNYDITHDMIEVLSHQAYDIIGKNYDVIANH